MNGRSGGFLDLGSDEVFKVEIAKQEFALELKNAMRRADLTNTALAEKLGVSKPMVSKLLRGDSNVTIETMVKAAIALGGQLYLKIMREGSSARFFEVAGAVGNRRGELEAHKNLDIRGLVNAAPWNIAANEEDNENESVAA